MLMSPCSARNSYITTGPSSERGCFYERVWSPPSLHHMNAAKCILITRFENTRIACSMPRLINTLYYNTHSFQTFLVSVVYRLGRIDWTIIKIYLPKNQPPSQKWTWQPSSTSQTSAGVYLLGAGAFSLRIYFGCGHVPFSHLIPIPKHSNGFLKHTLQGKQQKYREPWLNLNCFSKRRMVRIGPMLSHDQTGD